jgi:hypothetical protein
LIILLNSLISFGYFLSIGHVSVASINFNFNLSLYFLKQILRLNIRKRERARVILFD